MNGPIRTLLLTIALALMTTAAAAQDLPSDRFGPPLILRLKGVVEPTPEAARHTDGFAVVSLGFLGDGRTHGNHTAVDAGLTAAGGAGVAAMKNQNGATVELVSTTRGVEIGLGGAGVDMKVKK